MEVRFESMVFLWDDKIPTMFLEFMNLLTLCQSEGQLRAGVKDFAKKHELDKFFHYGFGSSHKKKEQQTNEINMEEQR